MRRHSCLLSAVLTVASFLALSTASSRAWARDVEISMGAGAIYTGDRLAAVAEDSASARGELTVGLDLGRIAFLDHLVVEARAFYTSTSARDFQVLDVGLSQTSGLVGAMVSRSVTRRVDV